MPEQTTPTCGEIGTGWPNDSYADSVDTEPCALPADHDEDHDWAQREAAPEEVALLAPAIQEQLQLGAAARIELPRVREQLAEAHAAGARSATTADRLREQLDRAVAQRDQLVDALREVLNHFTQNGHPGRPSVRTSWINTDTLDRWRSTLNCIVDQRRPEPAAEYLIWSHHHKMWFGPNGCGYRSQITDAGRYALDNTKQWLGRGCDCCRIPEVVIPAPGPDVLAGGGTSAWAAAQIEQATRARIDAGDVNAYAGSQL